MLIVINTLIPIFLLILLGYFFKRINFPHKDFWTSLDRFNYFVLFPSLLVYKLSTAKIENINGIDFILAGTIAIVLASILLIVLNMFVKSENSAFTSIYQGSVRFNTYVFLALVDALYKDEGIVIAALLITFMIPLLNILSIGVFSYYLSNTKVTLTKFIKSILKNPLILACMFGGGLNFLELRLPLLIENSLSILTLSALPLGLLSVGVGLHLSSLVKIDKNLMISTIIKLLIMPLIMIAVVNIFDLTSLQKTILIIFSTIPTATSAYILAKELGGDTKLMSAIISLQTILSIVSISLFLQFV